MLIKNLRITGKSHLSDKVLGNSEVVSRMIKQAIGVEDSSQLPKFPKHELRHNNDKVAYKHLQSDKFDKNVKDDFIEEIVAKSSNENEYFIPKNDSSSLIVDVKQAVDDDFKRIEDLL